MQFKYVFCILGQAILVAAPAFSQVGKILSGKIRILAEADSIKVVGTDAFPKDLMCDVHIGPKLFPCFHTEGGRGGLDSATIVINLDSSVSVSRKDTKKDSYVLSLFLEYGDKKALLLFDLNCDGQWDVKKTLPREKTFIFFGKEWFEVNNAEGLQSVKPTAAKGERQFEFCNGAWQKSTKGVRNAM